MPSRLQQLLTLFPQARVGLVLIILSALWVNACAWLSPAHLTEVERRQIRRRFREVIERAGGPHAWIKGAESGKLPPAPARKPLEALVEPAAFDTVRAAVQQEAKRQGLEIQGKVTRSQARGRVIELRITRRWEEVCRWRLREVRLRRAAIVIDDLGGDLEPARRLSSLAYPVTFSILPHLRHSVETAEEALRDGREVMLHLPMEPEPGSPVTTGQGVIKVGMSNEDVARTIQADLDSVPHAVGVNNHMGSRATAEPRLMAAVMKVLARQHLYFVDSRTTASSVALDVARRLGVPAFYRSVFLDDTKTTAYTLRQLREFRHLVEQQGAAVAIGHPYPTTLIALAQFLPELERDDIELIPVSRLLYLPEVARLSPPPPPAP